MNKRSFLPCLAMLLLAPLPFFSDGGEEKLSLYDWAVRQLVPETADSMEDSADTSKVNTDAPDEDGVTPLMLAAKEGNDWVVRTLLQAGADVNARDKDGWTALMYAVRYQNSSGIVSLLRDGGAALRVRNVHNFTPLLLAAAYGRNPDILSVLLAGRSGAEEEVMGAFILAVKEDLSAPLVKEEKLKVFLRKGVPVNGYFRGLTPLMYACRYGDSSLAARCLLEKGADLSLRGEDGKTALDYALENPSFPHDGVFAVLMEGKAL